MQNEIVLPLQYRPGGTRNDIQHRSENFRVRNVTGRDPWPCIGRPNAGVTVGKCNVAGMADVVSIRRQIRPNRIFGIFPGIFHGRICRDKIQGAGESNIHVVEKDVIQPVKNTVGKTAGDRAAASVRHARTGDVAEGNSVDGAGRSAVAGAKNDENGILATGKIDSLEGNVPDGPAVH